MSGFGFEEELEEENAFDEIPEFEQPEFEDIFVSSNIDESDMGRRREGNDRIGKPFLGKLAKARLIAARAGQLQLGSPPKIPLSRLRSGEIQEIAEQEFDEKVIPIKIVRRFADGTYEVWEVKDFQYIVRDGRRSERSRQRKPSQF